MRKTSKIYTALVFIFLYAPILIMIVYSFNSSNSTGVFTGFSLKWYGELFRNGETIEALRNTLILAVSSSVIATVMGTTAAVGIHSMKRKWVKNLTMNVTNIPMMNPDIVTGISLMLLFVFGGVLLNISGVLSFWTLLIAHITFNLPYVILSVLPKLGQVDKHLPEAAEDLGCTPLQSFFKVVLPSIIPGVATGLIMSFTLSLDDFVISYFNVGPKFQTLPIRIFAMTKKRVTPDIYALSAIIFVTILVLLILINLSQKKSEREDKHRR